MYNSKISILSFLLILLVALTNKISLAQIGGGYVISDEQWVDPISMKLDPLDLHQTPNWSDVRAIGMGKTQIANGRFFNAMLDNPALLSNTNYLYEVFGVRANFPGETFSAATFLKDNMEQFKKPDFYKPIFEGFKDYYFNAKTPDEKRQAIRKINQGLAFPNEVFDKVVGNPDEPYIHGVNMIPSVQIQHQNWGFSLFGNVQTGFTMEPGEVLTQLLSLNISENTGSLTNDMAKKLGQILGPLFTDEFELTEDELPSVFAMSYMDIVGAVGRSYSLNPNLHVGANLKIINRRFSTKLIDITNFDHVISDARSDIKASITGLTADIGALYLHPESKTRVGVAFQNLLPVKKIASSLTTTFDAPVGYEYDTDSYSNPKVGVFDEWGDFYSYPQGDTLLIVNNAEINLDQPVHLKAPFLANIGIQHPVNPNWDVALDWVDLFEQDKTFEKYIDRIRIGTEYRFPQYKYRYTVRAGIADRHLTFGGGLTLPYVQIDAAYAKDTFIGKGTFFWQVKVRL